MMFTFADWQTLRDVDNARQLHEFVNGTGVVHPTVTGVSTLHVHHADMFTVRLTRYTAGDREVFLVSTMLFGSDWDGSGDDTIITEHPTLDDANAAFVAAIYR